MSKSNPINESQLDITTIILAGGQSSRMGQDKALLLVQGQPLLQKICSLAQDCSSEVYLVTSRSDKYQDIVPGGCNFIAETNSQGPLVAFARGLAQVETEWVLLLACDLPKLEAATVKQWLKYLTDVPQEAIALLPKTAQSWEPLAGFYRRNCLSLLNQFIAQGGRAFQEWLSLHPVAELPLTEQQVLFNCNTPADLAQL